MSGLSGFRSVRLAGAVLPADALMRAADGAMPGQAPNDYNLLGTMTVSAAAARAWDVLLPAHVAWKAGLAKLPAGDAATGYTRDKWLLPLLYELGYGRPTALHAGIDLPPGLGETKPSHFPLSHELAWPQDLPTAALALHLLGPRVDLEHKTSGVTARAPHAMLQEFLNRSPLHLWGLLSNGTTLRLLRDASSFARLSYLEFDLDLIFDNQLYADFRLLFTTLHATRLSPRATGADEPTSDKVATEPADETEDSTDEHASPPAGPSPEDCWLETWRTTSMSEGTRALDALRAGVASAVTALGTGFVSHPDNTTLVQALGADADATNDLRRWLLRIAYRFIVLFVAEDRDLLHPPAADPAARTLYAEHFSATRLRELAATRTGSRHSDLWESHRLVTAALGGDGNPELALNGLAASLYEPDAVGLLRDAKLSNRYLLAAIRALSQIADKQTGATRPIDYRNLDSEELGSVYEGLLAYVPRYEPDDRTFTLEEAAGNERKKSGSYYTPSELITLVIDETLDPLIDEALRTPDPETALLALTVCDPACGSGHFLVAAARRIARALASVRAHDPEPSPEQYRSAMRDVVAHCVYGVDLNDLALEITKIALWLETLEPGKPLAFLDPHFRVGNALLGGTPRLLRHGIPDSAFAALEGDDKQWTAKLKRRNKEERDQPLQDMLFDSSALDVSTTQLTRQLREIEAGQQESLADVRARARAWRNFEASTEIRDAKRAADAWCAAFVQPKTGHEGTGITSRVVDRLVQEPEDVTQPLREQIDVLAGDFQFFHWHLEFPGIFTVPEPGSSNIDPGTGWVGGFSCVLGNPPWERVKIQEKEWFAAIGRDDIAKAPNAAKRRKAIAALAESDPPLYAKYMADQRKASATAHMLLTTGRYPFTGRGDVNTYSVFAETFRTITGPAGRSGVLTPTGIATDNTTAPFFSNLLELGELAAFYDFENEAKIFAGVDHRVRFAATVMTGRARTAERVRLAFVVRHIRDVPSRRFDLTPGEIALLNPNTGNLPVFRSRVDADITAGIYRRHPILVREDAEGGNRWGLTFLRMFDMANDSGLFRTQSDLAGAEWNGWSFADSENEWLPLYEAKLLGHYDHRLSTYAGATQAQLNMNVLPRVSDEAHRDPNTESLARYWVDAREVDKAVVDRWDRRWLLGWRDIARASDARTFVPSVMPRAAAGNKFPIAILADATQAALLQAIWSSLVFDYVSRQKLSGTGMTYFIVKQLPCPEPSTLNQPTPWQSGLPLGDWLRPRAIELSYTSWRLQPYALDNGQEGAPFIWDQPRREVIRAELDAAMMHVFGLERGEVEHVLDSFFVVRKYEDRDFGEYRTRRLVLSVYDEMARAIESGTDWSSTLTPVPGQGARHDS